MVSMVLAMICFGVIIEVIQHEFTLNRDGNIFDALANSVGALCGVGAVKYLFSKLRTLKWEI